MENMELKDVISELENKLMINTLHNCHICGSKLTLFHKTDFSNSLVIENASCSRCGVTLKSKTHTLH